LHSHPSKPFFLTRVSSSPSRMLPFPLHWPFHPYNLPRSLTLLFLLISGIHPNPGPSSPSNHNFNFLQFNVNGIKNSSAELLDFLTSNSIMVTCIQETKLGARSIPPTFPDYAFIRHDRPVGSGGGFAILIHHSVSYVNINTSILSNLDPSLELLAVSRHWWL
jgi:hypothetical protein